MKTANLLAAVAFAAAALPAIAQVQSTPRVDQRQENQQRRIDQGAQSGQLTQKEAARLQKGQARVQRLETKAAADGTVTKKERRRIENAQDKQSRRIAKQRHDRQGAR